MFLASLAFFSRSATALRCSSVIVRLEVVLWPVRYGYKGQDLAVQPLTSLGWSPKQLMQNALIADKGVLFISLSQILFRIFI